MAKKERKWNWRETKRLAAAEIEFLKKHAEKLRRRPTVAEAVFMKKLDYWGIKYIFQWVFYHRGYGGVCDFFLLDYRLPVEIDGGYHYTGEQIERDKLRNEVFLNHMNRPIFRLTNQEAMEWDNFTLMAQIQGARYCGRIAG